LRERRRERDGVRENEIENVNEREKGKKREREKKRERKKKEKKRERERERKLETERKEERETILLAPFVIAFSRKGANRESDNSRPSFLSMSTKIPFPKHDTVVLLCPIASLR
jgi:hypothetical protein